VPPPFVLRPLILSAVTALLVALSAAAPAAAQTTPSKDLADVLTECSQCGRFADLVRSAGLTDTLRGAGPYTLWAPTDAAVSGLPASTTRRLQQDPALLRDLVRYHLAPGTITAAQIVQVPTVKTVEGEFVRITAAGGTVNINDAPVVQPDVPATNGIIHVIGGVLIPPSQVQALPNTGSAASSTWPIGVALAGLVLAAAGIALRRHGANPA
jgi:LPXTG-motif cell wall-anchored protein